MGHRYRSCGCAGLALAVAAGRRGVPARTGGGRDDLRGGAARQGHRARSCRRVGTCANRGGSFGTERRQLHAVPVAPGSGGASCGDRDLRLPGQGRGDARSLRPVQSRRWQVDRLERSGRPSAGTWARQVALKAFSFALVDAHDQAEQPLQAFRGDDAVVQHRRARGATARCTGSPSSFDHRPGRVDQHLDAAQRRRTGISDVTQVAPVPAAARAGAAGGSRRRSCSAACGCGGRPRRPEHGLAVGSVRACRARGLRSRSRCPSAPSRRSAQAPGRRARHLAAAARGTALRPGAAAASASARAAGGGAARLFFGKVGGTISAARSCARAMAEGRRGGKGAGSR